MTLSLIDEMTKTKGRIGNIISDFFKSMGGCAMIGQSLINVASGAIGRLSGISAGLSLLLFLLLGWPLIQEIPLAALVDVMFMVKTG